VSVNVRIVGVRASDGVMLGKMINLKLMCDELKTEYPKELRAYFENTDAIERTGRDGILRAATEVDLQYGLKVEELIKGEVYEDRGLVIDLEKLPLDIKWLRVFME